MILPVDDCRLSLQRATVTLAELDRWVLNVNSLWMAGAMWSVYWNNSVIQRPRDFSGLLNGVESLF